VVLVNIIKTYRNIVAICDKELLGKKFEDEKFQLEIKESFYKGKEVNEKELVEIMKDWSMEDATFNIVGKKAISIALKTGLINQEGVKEIQGVPFALVLL
jgi:hypothetical protein